jgi:mRNA interferase RelE/StbE
LSNSNENINYTVVISADAQVFFEEASSGLQKKLDRCFERLKVEPRHHPNIKLVTSPQPEGVGLLNFTI